MKISRKTLLAVPAVFIVVLLVFSIFVNMDMSVLSDVSHMTAELRGLSPQVMLLDEVKLQTQPDAFTCGVTTISVVAAYCESKDSTPQSIMEKYNVSGGLSIERFVDILSQELSGYEVKYSCGLSDLELLSSVHEQLKRGIPVPVFFGAPNPFNEPHYDFHASVVSGIDLIQQKVRIANVYGFEEDISLTVFLSRMSYGGVRQYPLVQRVVIRLGLMKKNAFVALTTKNKPN